MSTVSPGTYVFQGLKFSLDILQDFSLDFPPPVSSVVNIVLRVVTIVENVRGNKEDLNLLKIRLLMLLPVVLVAVKEQSTGKRDEMVIPLDLKRSIDGLAKNLGNILTEVEKVQAIVNSTRKRDKLRAVILAKSYTSTLAQCRVDLDWAMKEFDVSSQLGNAIRICRILSNQRLDQLYIAKYARFDCERPGKSSGCLKGTRESILRDIFEWIEDPGVKGIFWLSGLAGTGKTTIAHTVADHSQSRGVLGGTFFFSGSGEAELRNAALVFPTIAYQLALFDPTFGGRITAALEAHPESPFSSLKHQCDRLIIDPLTKLDPDSNRTVVLIFDALDECEIDGARSILQLLHNVLSLPLCIKIFVTSRPEKHIRSVLGRSHKNLRLSVLHDMDATVVKSDIVHYLRDCLRRLPAERDEDISEDWVTDEEIEVLANAAGGLFVYAVACIRFLSDAINLRGQLDLLLQIVASPCAEADGTTPFTHLDQLYLGILRRLITPTNRKEVLGLLQAVLGSIVLLREPLPIAALERLTGLKHNEAASTVNLLHSVIRPPSPPHHTPQIFHSSFPDFLQDPERCTEPTLYVDTQTHERRIALQCLKTVTSKLHKGMLNTFDSMLANSEVEGIKSKVEAAFEPEVQYACRYWASHLATSPPGDAELTALLETFAAGTLLAWLESMSWLDATSSAGECLRKAKTWAINSACSSSTINILHDGYRLLLANFQTITTGAQHIARFVLPFIPRDTALASQYRRYADTYLKVIRGCENEWSPCLMVRHYDSGIHSLAICPINSSVASGCYDGAIDIWEASTSRSTDRLGVGWYEDVLSLAYSPDGSRLTCGLGDHTIQIWDAVTGSRIMTFRGHSNQVNSVVYSSDGLVLVSGSDDETIRLWDTSGECIRTLQGSGSPITSIAYSPNGTRIASGSHDAKVRIWDPVGGHIVHTLGGHHDKITCVGFSSDGSRLASSSVDHTVVIWDASTPAYNRLSTLVHRYPVSTIAFSPDGFHLASGDDEGLVRVWDVPNQSCVATLEGHTDCIRCISYASNGSQLVTGGEDGTIRIWDPFVETAHVERHSHSSSVTCVEFSSDGENLMSEDSQGHLCIWNAVAGTLVKKLDQGRAEVLALDLLSELPNGHPQANDDSNKSCNVEVRDDGGKNLPNTLGVKDTGDRDTTRPLIYEEGRLCRVVGEGTTGNLVCILPAELEVSVDFDEGRFAVAASFDLGSGVERIGIGCKDGRVVILEVQKRI